MTRMMTRLAAVAAALVVAVCAASASARQADKIDVTDSTTDGSVIWDFNTVREYDTVNKVPAKGGSIDAAGPAIAGGLLATNSGYAIWRGLPGDVLLAFSAK